MLLEFTAQNYLSFKDPIVFTMNASRGEDDRNIFNIKVGDKKTYKILNSAVIYGANGGGKSNLLLAMNAMKAMIVNAEKIIQSTEKIRRYSPFLLNSETENAATEFEVTFFIGSEKFRYGFEYDQSQIYSEWLFIDTNGKESKLFSLDVDSGSYVNQKFEEGFIFFDQDLKKVKGLRKNQLFLWKCDENAGEISGKIMRWFLEDFNMIDANNHEDYFPFTSDNLKNDEFSHAIKNLVKKADFGIEDLKYEEFHLTEEKFEELEKSVPEKMLPSLLEFKEKVGVDFHARTVETMHTKYDASGQAIGKIGFDIDELESVGTRKFFRLSGPIIDTLKRGSVIILDEIDASLHPLLTIALIEMFQDPAINKNRAQLIFSTHDTNLLNPALFRRDQIWFVEKDHFGASHPYSLSDIKGVRAAEAFGRQYLNGKYRAIPDISKLEF